MNIRAEVLAVEECLLSIALRMHAIAAIALRSALDFDWSELQPLTAIMAITQVMAMMRAMETVSWWLCLYGIAVVCAAKQARGPGGLTLYIPMEISAPAGSGTSTMQVMVPSRGEHKIANPQTLFEVLNAFARFHIYKYYFGD